MPEPIVVLIEDEPQIRRFLRVTLTGEGYRLFEATSGAAGLVEAATRQPDVVIVDLGLPDMDGLEVIRRLREWTKVPVIVLSARGQERGDLVALLPPRREHDDGHRRPLTHPPDDVQTVHVGQAEVHDDHVGLA